MSALTPKQKRFCEEYVIDFNGAQAAIRAGYSKKTAASIAVELLAKPYLTEYIHILQTKLQEQSGVNALMVINELALCGFSNLQDYIKSGNDCKDFSKVDRKLTAAMSSIKVTEVSNESGSRTTTEFKLHDKISALQMLGKHLGIFETDNHQKASKFVVKLK